MKFRLINGELSINSDDQAIDSLTKKMITLAAVIDLFNESDWQPAEARMWLQYEKDLALTESKLLQENYQNQ